jgi:pSer/pThr/pTyr-binding forkhead associated (FHA) protein
VLGREAAPGVDIVLPHPRVSAPHALFRLRTDGSLTVTDLGSTNGTFVRGEEIPRDRPVALAHGDRVGIGRDLHYEVSQPATAPEVQAPSPKLPRARPVAQTVYEPLGPGPASKKLEP